MITDDHIKCWKINYGLDNKSPADAMRWWNDNNNGMAPAGAVAALGLCLEEMERMRATIERLREYARHTPACYWWSGTINQPHPCDCGYDELMAELEESKCKKY
ncbi:MAG: hypothetical protein KBG29_01520 [Pseudomonadales bacterium]|jgi:hypothetical protein|nr:hypothetical protein [Pseudomonadales bacterium]